MFILAHQFRGVSSENNRRDTYPAEALEQRASILPIVGCSDLPKIQW